MAAVDLVRRAGPFVLSAFEDDDLREQLLEALTNGRKAINGARGRRKAPPETLLRRAGASVRASGGALSALGRVEEPAAPKRRGRTLIALGVAGGLVAAVASRSPNPTTQGAAPHGS